MASDRKQTIQIWDVITGKEVRRLQGHSGFIVDVALSPDGKLVASASRDETIRLWVTATGREVLRLGDLQGEVKSVAFCPDGKTLASIAGSRLHFHDIRTGKLVDELKRERIQSVTFSPNGKSVATADWAGSQIRLRDASTHEVIHSLVNSARVRCIAFSRDGKTLAAGGGDTLIRLWDVATGKEISGPTGHENAVLSLTFLQEGKVLGTESEDGTIRLWDAVTGKEAHKVRIRSKNKGGPGFAFSPDGKSFVFVPDWQDKHICLWDLGTGRELRRFSADEVVRSLGFSPRGTVLAASTKHQMTLLFEVATGRVLRHLAGPESTHFLTFSPDGKALAGIGEDHTVYVWNMDSGQGKTIGTLAGVTIYNHLQRFSPDGKAVLVSGDDSAVRLWDVATRKEMRTLVGHRYDVRAGAFAPDGRVVASGGSDETVRLWEIATGKEIRKLYGHRGPVSFLAFSADGKALGSASHDTTALVWSVPDVLRGGTVHAGALTEKELKSLRADLAALDPGEAYRAIWTMIPAPAQTVPFLNQQLRPAAPADQRRIAELLKELDDKQFAVREKAAKELEKLGELAEPALRKGLAANPSAEVRKRLEQLFQKLQGPITKGETLQGLRAVAVLEQIATPEAQEVLKTLSKGAPEARLTQEANAALERLAKGSAAKP